MPSITVTDLPIARDELLMLFWHRRAGAWWATVGPKNADTYRACGEGATPAVALGELMLALGARVERPN